MKLKDLFKLYEAEEILRPDEWYIKLGDDEEIYMFVIDVKEDNSLDAVVIDSEELKAERVSMENQPKAWTQIEDEDNLPDEIVKKVQAVAKKKVKEGSLT